MGFRIVASLLVAVGLATAADPVTLPSTGVDMPGLITAIVTGLGAVIVAALAATGAFLLVRKGWAWVRRI